ncbi:TPA: hypothetical protein SL218_004572 [Pseudomonas aeruginosa]|nr:hypothetical protein [Pseudomonas aeruginosa]HEJ2774328.1 hypothetical protein [Pseudomonas aeruginosa]
MRTSIETVLARVVAVFGAAKPYCVYLFANHRSTRMPIDHSSVENQFRPWGAQRAKRYFSWHG